MIPLIELEFTDDQIANFPSYSWPLQCCWCGTPIGSTVRAREVDGLTFVCQMCGKPNSVRRRSNKVTITPAARMPGGCLLISLGLITILTSLFFHYRSSLHLSSLPHFQSLIPPGLVALSLTLLKWTGYLAGFLVVIRLPFQFNRWRGVRRLYGRIPWSLVWQMKTYALKNKVLRIYLGIVYFMIFFGFIPIVLNYLGAELLGWFRPFPEASRIMQLPVLLIFLYQLERIAWHLSPPAALLLGTSKNLNVHLVGVLNAPSSPYRVISLLDTLRMLSFVNGHQGAVTINTFPFVFVFTHPNF